jgi:hypothetical protein
VTKSKKKCDKREQRRLKFARKELDALMDRKKRLTELILEEKKKIEAYQVSCATFVS